MKDIRIKEKGFTLGELLVVIAIMTILVAVAVGSFIGLIGSGSGISKQYEKESVDVAIEAHMDTTLSTTITERDTAAVITSSDIDAPFATFLRRLPTQYEYSWTASGSVTQSGDAGAGGSGPSLPTPIAQWHFNQGSGGNAIDSIGGFDGTIYNATWTTDSVSGNALNFDGTGDYVDTSLVATSLTGDYSNQVIAKLFFDANLFILGSLFYFNWDYATKNKRLVDPTLEKTSIKKSEKRALVIPAVSVLAMLLALIIPSWSGLTYLLVPITLVWVIK